MCQKHLKISNHSKKNLEIILNPNIFKKKTLLIQKKYQTQCKSSFQSQYLHMLFQIVDHPRPLIFF
jgi:hypothetical protein